MRDFEKRLGRLSPAKRALFEKKAGLDRGSEEIAVIGMSCRFPGGAVDPEKLWSLLKDGVDAIVEVPPDRWDADEYYDAESGIPGKMNSRWGGFLDDIDMFDAQFFGISPKEAKEMDPQQRIFLEVAYRTIEDAGLKLESLSGSKTGVFVGFCNTDYFREGVADPGRMNSFSGTGLLPNIIPGRLSYLMNLRGPAIAIDTACSSSLVAVHLACQSLRSRECDIAIAGGVNLVLSPLIGVLVSGLNGGQP